MSTETAASARQLFDRVVDNPPHSELWKHIGDRIGHEFKCDDQCGLLTIMAGPDGDMHAFMSKGDSDCHFGPPAVRARTFGGGGRSERVRVALMLLAVAIEADSEPLKRAIRPS
jgi:hypothetical protein